MENQAVVDESNADPKQESAADQNAQEPSLDELLSSYEEPKESPKPEAPADPTELQEMRAMVAEMRQEKQESAILDAAKSIKGELKDLPVDVPEYVLKGALREKAVEDPRIVEVFERRGANPKAWNEVIATLGKQIAKDMVPVDKQATDSWNAVESAVRSTSTHTPTDSGVSENDLKDMSLFELNQYKAKLKRQSRR